MINFEQIQTFFMVLMAILGFLTVVFGLVNAVRNWHQGSSRKRHEERLNNHEKRIQFLESETSGQEKYIHVLSKALLAMINHEINGNSIEGLKEAKTELENFLIKK